MSQLIWVGNTLYPRWLVFAALALLVITTIGLGHVLQMSFRCLQQRQRKIL